MLGDYSVDNCKGKPDAVLALTKKNMKAPSVKIKSEEETLPRLFTP